MATSGPNYATSATNLADGGATGWASTANATGTDNDVYAVWTKAGGTAAGTLSQALELSGFGTFTGPVSGDTINSVTVTVNAFVAQTARVDQVRFQLYDGTTPIGTEQQVASSATTTTTASFAFTGVTFAQLSTLRVRVRFRAGATTTSSSGSVDYASLTVDYTPSAVSVTKTPATVAATSAIPTPTAGRTQTFSFAGTTGTVTGLTPGQQYAVQVRAVDAAGNRSALSAPVTFTTSTATNATATPATVAATAAVPVPSMPGGTGATRSPATVAAAASVPAPTAGTIRTFTFAGTSGQVTGLTPGVGYTARVRARDAAGNWSALSAPVSFTTNGAGTASPATVSATTAIPTPNGGGTPPTVAAGTARPVVNGGTVLLDVTATPPAGQSIAAHSWAIISGGGSLTNAATATPTYTAPASGSGLAVIRDAVTASGGGTATADVTVSYHSTVVAAENALTGTARATWDLASPNLAGVNTLQGFCDGFTADKSETVNFKIAQSDGAGWSAQVYRLGWYAGNGARLVDTLTPTSGQLSASQSQPAPGDADTSTSKLSADCGNWATTLTWTPPSWALSGIYILRLNRTGGGASHVMFIIRDDARSADLMLMPSDSTWQAYNAFGGMGASLMTGNSLYYGTPVDQYNADCARFVSYNRPFVNRAAANTGEAYGAVEWSTFFTGEYPMLRFLERNGFDVKYYGCIDAAGDSTGAKLANVNAAMAVGHNEYWSDGMRAGWEAAKANGTSLFFCASNEVFWRLVGTNPDASGRPRTWECQKSTINGRGNTRPEWTGTWRDPDGAGKGGNAPENTLTGTIFVVNGPDLRSIVVPATGGYSAQPIWRHTTVASLTAGQSWTSPTQILGFEWDTYGPAGTNGAGSTYLAAPHPQARYCSDVTYAVSSVLLLDAGDVYGSGNATHRLVVHPGGNGGIVFGTGTINWAFGVDNANTYQCGNDNTSSVIQQATVNMLADMGAGAASLMAGLTAPTPVAWFTATTVVATASIPTPTVVTSTSATRTPGTVTASAVVPSPTVTTGVTRAPATVTATAAIPTAAVVTTGTATAQPSTVAAVASVPTPAASTGWRVAPATVTASAAVPAPTVRVSAALTLTTVHGVAAVASPTVLAQAHATAQPVTVAALASVPAPSVTTFSKTTYRPFGGTTARSDEGTTARPNAGLTLRP